MQALGSWNLASLAAQRSWLTALVTFTLNSPGISIHLSWVVTPILSRLSESMHVVAIGGEAWARDSEAHSINLGVLKS